MRNKLAVIGFDAQFDGLENIDRVAAAFYQGELYNSELKMAQAYSYAQLYQLSATRVIEANNLTGQQVAMVIVSDPLSSLRASQDKFFCSEHARCEWVVSFADALTVSAKIINDLDLAVLIIAANLLDHPAKQTQSTISYANDFNGYGQSCGVGCVLLSSKAFALNHGCYIYSYLESFATSKDVKQIKSCIAQSFTDCALSSARISSLEVSAPANLILQNIEQSALLASYNNDLTLHTSLSCVKSVIGENGPLSQLCGFLNAVLALQQRYCPAVKDWNAPRESQLTAWLNSPFYLLNESAPAFPEKDGTPRYMGYSCLSAHSCGYSYAHLILKENGDNQVHSNGFTSSTDLSLFVITGNCQAELTAQLGKLNGLLTNATFKALAKACYQDYQENSDANFCAVLLAASAEQLSKEISLALTGIPSAFVHNDDWKTPQGSYFSANPSTDHKTCFLYPGIGATYLGLGRALLHLFPQIYPSLLTLINDSEAGFKDKLLNPRSVIRPDFDFLKQHDLVLRRKLADIAECGVGYACLFTRVFNDVLNINADFAAGYSMGEVSMFAALNCWQNPGHMSARLAESQTFNEQLSGELKTLRSLWKIPATAEGGERLLWESYNIKGTKKQVEEAILAHERVYITLINTPDSLVIAGYPNDCLAVAKRLGVRSVALNVHNAIHSEPAYQQYQQMIELYSMDLAQRIPTRLYSSSCYLPIPFNKKAISVSIAKCLCEQVDFPRLLNTLVDHGASLFLEMGAGRSLCTWSDKVFAANGQQQNCKTVAVNAKGSDQQLMIMRAIAKLLSVGVKINLKHFFYGSIIQPVKN